MAPGFRPRQTPEPACLVALWLLLMPAAGFAQSNTPFVVDEWRFGTRESNATLSYCIDARDPDWPVARDIAAAVAARCYCSRRNILSVTIRRRRTCPVRTWTTPTVC